MAVVGLLVSVALVAMTGWSSLRSPERNPVVQTPPAPTSVASEVSVSPTPTPTPNSTPTPTSAPTLPPTPPPEPTRVLQLDVPSAGYSSTVGTMEIADTGVIDPPDFEHTWWIRDRGVVPGSRATDTAYLACHTHSRRTAAEVPCNLVQPEAVPVGAEMHVTTDAEELTYRIIDSRKVPRGDFATDDEVWDVNPGRLVWITCYLNEGQYSEFNYVVIGELVQN